MVVSRGGRDGEGVIGANWSACGGQRFTVDRLVEVGRAVLEPATTRATDPGPPLLSSRHTAARPIVTWTAPSPSSRGTAHERLEKARHPLPPPQGRQSIRQQSAHRAPTCDSPIAAKSTAMNALKNASNVARQPATSSPPNHVMSAYVAIIENI